MKRILPSERNPSLAIAPSFDHQSLTELFLEQFPEQKDWISTFSQDWSIAQLELGDDIAISGSESPLWFVCRGRIRLVSHDTVQRREVSTVLLESGDFWGADSLFCTDPLPYRAIAATSVLVATLPQAQLMTWQQRYPHLRSRLEKVTRDRQVLIFFKTRTDLRSLSSHVLKALAFTEIDIPAQSKLAQATPSDAGRFWLRQGEIQSQTALQVGESWGYPEAVPEDWIAKTPLRVYQLSVPQWEMAQTPAQPTATPKITRLIPPQPSAPETPPQPALTENRTIEFAKPKARRRRGLGQAYPYIAQQSSSDCGAACLAMIAQYWGKRLSLNAIREMAGVGRSGASIKGLAYAAERLGFQARPVRSSFSQVAKQPMPWIAHWQGDHYVVVYRVRGERVIMADPAVGKRSLSVKEFQASWTHYALLLSPTEVLQAIPSSKPSLKRFLGAFAPYRSMLVPILFATILLQGFGLVTPLFTQLILDRVVVHKSLPTLHVFIVGLLMFGFWRIGLGSIRQYLLDFFSNQVDLTLVSSFISHTLNLPLSFFANRHVGDIVTRVQENHKIQMFLTRQAVAAWLDAIMAVVYVGLMLHYNWQLTILVLALLPPIILLTVIASPFLRQISRQIFNESAKQSSTLVEMLTGISTVKATASERELRWKWEEDLTNQFNAQFRGQKLTNGLQALSGAINMLGSTILLWYGATLVIQDQLSIGQYVAFNMMIGNVIGPVLSLVGLWDELQEVLVSVERLNDIFSAQPEESPDNPLLVLPPVRGEVCFEQVTFRYSADDERNILQTLSFVAQPGTTTAIVGRSGSGKTTLINLLQGLYQPTAGRITVDGHDLRHVSPQSLRCQLGVVPQECFLFSGTILENITLYRSEYTLEEAIAAAKLAEAHSFIQSLPLGYHTKVGERGATLSGGQRQRIAIARALLSYPRILVLDEATSSLDTESERKFQKNLQQISRDRTTFIIAHRLSTVRHADCILVLDQGILIEQGTHAELIQKRGLYAQLTNQQLDL